MVMALERSVEASPDLSDKFETVFVRYAEQSLRGFIPVLWHVIEPFTPYKPNWHIDEICYYLEAVEAGEIRNLLVTMPPRMLKSITISVMYPAWRWIAKPWIRFLYASYADNLATEHSVATRRVIQSPFYQRNWGDRFQLAYDSNLKTRFENNYMGARVATSVGGIVTGRGGDRIVVDDPHNVMAAESETKRREALLWWDKSMSSRFNDPATGARIIVMQRVHFEDLAGHVLEQGGYVHLNLPMEYEPRAVIHNPWGKGDPRTEPGEILSKDRVRPEDIADWKLRQGARTYNGQYQQRPSPAEGGTFKTRWNNYWHPAGVEMRPVEIELPDGSVIRKISRPLPGVLKGGVFHPVGMTDTIQSWDTTFKDTKDADYVSGQVWSFLGADSFLLNNLVERMDFPAAVKAVRQMKLAWPESTRILIEDKANGPAVISTLARQIPGLLAVNPHGGKQVRANAITYMVEAGNVYFPHPDLYDWMDSFLAEMADFPDGKHDDQVDAMTQALKQIELLMAKVMDAPESVGGDTYFPVTAADIGSDSRAWEDDPWG